MDSKKLYYSHREVTEMLEETQSTVRYWVETFAVQVRRRDDSSIRRTIYANCS